jgi:UDP-N-acetylmuramoyl-L-alanyl-D-glutamate--2,6-diaminopimelate ligase
MAREICEGRVIAVVGSAGDRDAKKRPLMGAAAALAHIAVITSDNPRSEDPEALVAAVVAGTVGSMSEIIVEVDRTQAIHIAIDRAEPGDAVLILGKGHEQGQDFGHTVIPFDDRTVAADYLRARRAS